MKNSPNPASNPISAEETCAHPAQRNSTPSISVDLQLLEDRVLYSAGPIPVDFHADTVSCDCDSFDTIEKMESVADELFSAMDQLTQLEFETSLQTPLNFESAAIDSGRDAQKELIVIDQSIEGYQDFVDDILESSTARDNFELLFLEPGKESLAQITEALGRNSGLKAIHIVSHGRDGQLQLGDTVLSQESMVDHTSELAKWNRLLGDGTDLLIYGCELAATAHGQSFVDQLAELTGTDIAASDDVTGHSALGGDWQFEYVVGTVDSTMAFSSSIVDSWHNSLILLDSTSEGGGTYQNGNDYNINGTTDSVGADYLGNLVVVTSSSDPLLATEGMDVLLRRVDVGGAETAFVQVNNNSTGDQKWASVAVANDGTHVVVWTSEDGGSTSIWASIYDGDGNLVQDDFQVDSETLGSGGDDAKVAINYWGDFVVTWEAPDSDGDGIFVKQFDQYGNALGTVFQVNTTTAGNQGNADVSINDVGEVVVAWDSFNENNIGENSNTYLRRISDLPNGVAYDEVAVEEFSTVPSFSPSVEINSQGQVVIAYVTDSLQSTKSNIITGPTTTLAATSIVTEVFTLDSSATGLAQVGVTTGETVASEDGIEYAPRVALFEDDTFAVSWEGVGPNGYGGTDDQGVYVRTYEINEGSNEVNSLTNAEPLIIGAPFESGVDTFVVDPDPVPLPGADVAAIGQVWDAQVSGTIVDFRSGTQYVKGFTGVSWESGTPDDDYHWERSTTFVDDRPTGADKTLDPLTEDTRYFFDEADFGFNDLDGDAFHGVSLETLPTNGKIYLGDVEVTTKFLIPIAEIQAGNLVFLPDTNFAGSDSFTFKVHTEFIDSAVANTISITVDPAVDGPGIAAGDHLISIAGGQVATKDIDLDQSEHKVAALTGGGYVIAWNEERSGGTHRPQYKVFASDGSIVRDESNVHGGNFDSTSQPEVIGFPMGALQLAGLKSTAPIPISGFSCLTPMVPKMVARFKST